MSLSSPVALSERTEAEAPGAAADAASGAGGGSSAPLLLPGLLLVLISLVWFCAMTFALLGVHALPAAADGHGLVAALQQDSYYALLLPLCIPVILVAVHLSWFSWKLYRHS